MAQKYNVRYNAKIITNGFLLKPKIAEDLLKNCCVDDYEITLDGTAIFHDQRRHTKAMGSSFDIIYENLKELASLETAKIVVRCNVDDRNKEGVIPLLKQLHDDNLHQKISFYAAPIHSWGNDAHLLAAEKKQFSIWEIDWLIEMKKFGFATNYLSHRAKSICFAVNPEQELIDPYGEIYGCSEVSLVPSYVDRHGHNIHKLGHVEESTIDHQKRKTFGDFYEEAQIKKFDCASCRMLPTCGGSCPKEWVEGRTPCPSTKFNIEQRILLAYLAN